MNFLKEPDTFPRRGNQGAVLFRRAPSQLCSLTRGLLQVAVAVAATTGGSSSTAAAATEEAGATKAAAADTEADT